MSRHTKKVGIIGKYGIRYGASIRKQIKKVEITQHAKYDCPFCGKVSIKRQATGIWTCKSCRRTVAGGAYLFETAPGLTARGLVSRLRRLNEEETL